jgi:hypothetical protein
METSIRLFVTYTLQGFVQRGKNFRTSYRQWHPEAAQFRSFWSQNVYLYSHESSSFSVLFVSAGLSSRCRFSYRILYRMFLKYTAPLYCEQKQWNSPCEGESLDTSCLIYGPSCFRRRKTNMKCKSVSRTVSLSNLQMLCLGLETERCAWH